MNLFVPQRRFDPSVPELMDRVDSDPEILRDDLKNLRTINRLFGGLSAVQKNILALLGKIDQRKQVEILDLATGSADHPIALVKLCRKLGRSVQITAVDKNPTMLQISREQTKDFPEITIKQCDILSPPYPDRSFDVVLCSLAIHHFSREDAVKILQHMNRLSRVGFIVNDLNRSWIGAWTAWLYTHLTTRNPMTLNDSYVSVLRAFTREELKELAEEASIQKFEIFTQPFFRLILIGRH